MKDGMGGVYVAMDNTDERAWCEEFDIKEECIDWLNKDLQGRLDQVIDRYI